MTPEPILPIRLIALDIDGTLVGDDLEIGPDTRAAVRAARARGVIVSLVTGRMVSSAMHFARELELDSPVVGYQGALIREMPAAGSDRLGRLLVHTPMPASVAREIVAWTRERGLDPHLNHLERLIVRTDDPRADEYGAFIGGDPELSGDLVESIRHPITKILAAGEPPLPSELAPLARERFDGAGRGDHQPSAFPRVHGTRRVEGPRDPLARPPDADPARGRAGHRRPVERHRDARRGRPRGGDADRAGRGQGGRTVRRSAAGRGGRRPDDRGAGPGAAGPRLGRPRRGWRRRAGRRGTPTPTSPPWPSRRERAHRRRRRRRSRRGDRGPRGGRRRRAADRHGLRDRRRP